MKKGILVGALLAIGVIYIHEANRKNKKSTSSEQIYNL